MGNPLSKMSETVERTRTSHDAVACEYAERFKDEMDQKQFDRRCLDRLASEVGDLGPICDFGCGPGQIARYLHRKGVAALGVDLSPRIVAEAGRLNPDIEVHQGEHIALPTLIDPGVASRRSIASSTSPGSRSWGPYVK
jgi:2-polyprenyl-3-methyl-5-hydroxy-6-metoxy-1,4-benzoquinol methylase